MRNPLYSILSVFKVNSTPGVAQATDVTPRVAGYTIARTGTGAQEGRKVELQEQVLGLLVVPVGDKLDATIEEAEVDTDVGRVGGLPLQVRVGIVGIQYTYAPRCGVSSEQGGISPVFYVSGYQWHPYRNGASSY